MAGNYTRCYGWWLQTVSMAGDYTWYLWPVTTPCLWPVTTHGVYGRWLHTVSMALKLYTYY